MFVAFAVRCVISYQAGEAFGALTPKRSRRSLCAAGGVQGMCCFLPSPCPLSHTALRVPPLPPQMIVIGLDSPCP